MAVQVSQYEVEVTYTTTASPLQVSAYGFFAMVLPVPAVVVSQTWAEVWIRSRGETEAPESSPWPLGVPY